MNENIIAAEPARERTPALIGAEIRMYAEAGRRITLLCAIEIGRRLTEAKELLNHGEWLPWLERETEFSDRSAARYMKVFDEYGKAQQGLFGPETNSPTLSNLPISKALALLSVPESERVDFAEEVDAEHISVRELEEKIRERDAELTVLRKDRELSDKAREDAELQLKRIKKELEEIEARPQPVAVERDEKAIREAVEAAELKAQKELDEMLRKQKAENDKKVAELKKQISDAAIRTEKIEAHMKAEQERADAAAKAASADAELQKQVETLKKQLALAAPEVAEFKAAFDRAQDELVHMNEALHKIGDEEIREKLRKACAAMLDGFSERVKA